MRERDTTRKYLMEFGGAMIAYVVVLYVSLTFAKQLEAGFARNLVLLSPMAPIGLAIWAYMRQLRRVDEFVRLRSLQALAVAGGIVAGFSITYGFLENAGLPRVSMFTVWAVFGVSWAVASVGQGLYCRLVAR